MESRPGNLIVISAPSGAGKTSLVHALMKHMDGIRASVSHTTRARRPGENDGEDYFFVDEPTFREMIAGNKFLEYAEVFGNLYGTSNKQIQLVLDNGTDLLLEIDWQGARRIRETYPGSVSIFVLPPSEAALRERLVGRAGDEAVVIEQRMQAARSEMSHFAEYEFLLVNDDFDVALEELCAIVRACRLKTALRRRALGPDLARLIASGDAV